MRHGTPEKTDAPPDRAPFPSRPDARHPKRCRGIEELRELLRVGARRFRDRKYEEAQRVITDWLKTVVLERLHITEPVPELHDFEGVYTMLEQSVDGWKDQYIQQGVAQGMAQGEERGIQIGEKRGRELGFLDALFSCAGEGLLPVEAAAAKANMSVEEFRTRMRDRERGRGE